MLISFLYNTTVIIAFVFLSIRFKNYLVKKKNNYLIYIWSLPIINGLLTIIVMYTSFQVDNMTFDLRSIPIFLTSYIWGLKVGLLSCVLPISYQISQGGQNIWAGIISLVVTALVAGIFSIRDKESQPDKLPILKPLLIFISFHILKNMAHYIALDFELSTWIEVNLIKFIFAIITMTITILIINDANRSFFYKKELEHNANYDYMTDLTNLRYFKSKVNQLIKKGCPIVIAMLDIDFFKEYNDTHGHPAGDEVLKTIANILKESTRDNDLVGRYGGEEFILCFSNITSKDAVFAITQRIRRKIEEYPFKGRESQPTEKLTVSIGISNPGQERDLDSLIEEADKALYKSKQEGKNQVRYFKECAYT